MLETLVGTFRDESIDEVRVLPPQRHRVIWPSQQEATVRVGESLFLRGRSCTGNDIEKVDLILIYARRSRPAPRSQRRAFAAIRPDSATEGDLLRSAADRPIYDAVARIDGTLAPLVEDQAGRRVDMWTLVDWPSEGTVDWKMPPHYAPELSQAATPSPGPPPPRPPSVLRPKDTMLWSDFVERIANSCDEELTIVGGRDG
jgi:hypothetical protein